MHAGGRELKRVRGGVVGWMPTIVREWYKKVGIFIFFYNVLI